MTYLFPFQDTEQLQSGVDSTLKAHRLAEPLMLLGRAEPQASQRLMGLWPPAPGQG